MTSLSEPMQAVVALFKGPLAGVRFADVDATGLTGLAAEVSAAAAEVEQQEAKLSTLRQGLAQRQEALLSLAQQALAYARVYAENDEELSAKLNAISLPRAAKPRKPAVAKSRSATEGETSIGAAPVEQEAQTDDATTNDDAQAAADEANEVPAKTKPSYARPKIKRRLGRAAPQGDSV